MHKWPDAIVFDTALPPPVIAAEIPSTRTPRDALALLPQMSPVVVANTPVTEAKPVAMKHRSKTLRAASRRIASYRATGPGDVFLPGW
jgi:hypothetical protein